MPKFSLVFPTGRNIMRLFWCNPSLYWIFFEDKPFLCGNGQKRSSLCNFQILLTYLELFQTQQMRTEDKYRHYVNSGSRVTHCKAQNTRIKTVSAVQLDGPQWGLQTVFDLMPTSIFSVEGCDIIIIDNPPSPPPLSPHPYPPPIPP